MGSARTGSNPVGVAICEIHPVARCLMARRGAMGQAARLAQLVERKALNLVVVGSSPTVGAAFFNCKTKNNPNAGKKRKEKKMRPERIERPTV